MRIDHKLLEKLHKKALDKVWIPHNQCGVNFKKPYMSDGSPSSYQRLFLEFINQLRQTRLNGVSGTKLREVMGWRKGTHSDYFSMFTTNGILNYNKRTRLYEKGENFDSYCSYSIAKEKECKQ